MPGTFSSTYLLHTVALEEPIAAGSSIDVIEMDAASNRSVDDIRDLRERVAFAPAAGGWKVYILDEAHMLTKEAWNAFLKTLEEPPPNTVFVLATTEAHKVMPTITDRCQRFDFQRPSLDQIATVLKRVAEAEQIEIEDPAVAIVARSASGSFRDALGTLDQLVAFNGPQVELDRLFAAVDNPKHRLIVAGENLEPIYTHSLQVAVFAGDETKRRSDAERYCARLRGEGHEAYYYHGRRVSSVTIGAFTSRDFNLDTGMVSPRLERLQEQFPHNLYNGEIQTHPATGDEWNSALVQIPRTR